MAWRRTALAIGRADRRAGRDGAVLASRWRSAVRLRICPTSSITNAARLHAYISRGLGRTLGLGGAFLATFSYAAIGIGLYGAFAVFASTTFADLFGLSLSWQAWAAIGVALSGTSATARSRSAPRCSASRSSSKR